MEHGVHCRVYIEVCQVDVTRGCPVVTYWNTVIATENRLSFDIGGHICVNV